MRVGFIGLGTMGRHLATNIQGGEWQFVVHDIRKDSAAVHLNAGAEWANTPAELMSMSDVVFTSLPMPSDVESVALGANGLIEGAGPGKVYFDMSTNSPTIVRRIHEHFAPLGTSVLDAPVSGGPSAAESGRLAIYVGGDESVFLAHQKMLGRMGDQIIYVGPIGGGTVAKLVHNLTTQSVNLAIAEAMMLGARAGVDPLVLWRAIRQGTSGRRRTFDFTRFYRRSFDTPTFRLSLAQKDVRLAVELARELNVPLRLSGLTLDELNEALGRGWGDRDSSTVFLLQEERAGVHIEFSQDEVDITLKE